LGVSTQTIKREWSFARTFLLRELQRAQSRQVCPAKGCAATANAGAPSTERA
jgi:hypothetical protein